MKLNDKIPRSSLLLWAVGIAGITTSSAALVAPSASGDLFLAFRASGGQGASVSYLVNIGQASQITNAPPDSTIFFPSVGGIGTDLSTTYSAGWNTRGNLFWSVIGTTDSISPTLYVTKERFDINIQTVPYNPLTAPIRSGVKTEILSVTSGINGYDDLQSSPNNTAGAFQPNSNEFSSYNFQVTRDGTDFGSQSQWNSVEGDFGGGGTGTALDFYRLRNNGTTPVTNYLGTFNIGNDGTLSFTSAIPEPSLPILATLGTTLLVLSRRRSSNL